MQNHGCAYAVQSKPKKGVQGVVKVEQIVCPSFKHVIPHSSGGKTIE